MDKDTVNEEGTLYSRPSTLTCRVRRCDLSRPMPSCLGKDRPVTITSAAQKRPKRPLLCMGSGSATCKVIWVYAFGQDQGRRSDIPRPTGRPRADIGRPPFSRPVPSHVRSVRVQ
ncbi:hypothetical protein KPB2_5505 [Klebsiella pneumoniae Kb677]|nr:hypothetical protein KPB2_5505 [Klebsiella pneumoniae Kb677]